MERPVVEFDHHGREFNEDPIAQMAELRAKCPVAWSDAHGGFWVAADYDSVHEVSADAGSFSSVRTQFGGEGVETLIPKNPAPHLNLPIESDPPEHGRFRRLLNPVVSPTATERLQPVVDRWTTFFIDRWIEQGSCDFAYDLASPVPAVVTLQWLGLPTDEWERIAHSYHDIMGSPPGSEQFLEALHVQRTVITQLLFELIAERRREPRDDIISYIVNHGLDGEAIGDETAYSLCSVLLAGGVDTTTALTCHALVHLWRNPDDRRRLIEQPELLDRATEEFLRVYPPVPSSARTVKKPVEVADCRMEPGDRVLFMRWSANLDERAFPDADQFVLDRFPNRHTTFGIGPHRCAGSHIARALFKTMIQQVLERLPDYEIDEAGLVPYADQGAFTGWGKVPATFTPGPRRGG